MENQDKLQRPILVEFSNAHLKNVIMANVTSLGSAKGEFEGVTISHGMTIKERQQCKSLVVEAKIKQNEETGNCLSSARPSRANEHSEVPQSRGVHPPRAMNQNFPPVLSFPLPPSYPGLSSPTF